MADTSSKITRNSARRNRERKKINHLRNQRVRADLYSELQGERANKDPRWHSVLDALSRGTA
jgi:hypothetical protein